MTRGRAEGAHPALARLRALCTSLPGATERSAWGHPNFRTRTRTFATFEWIDGRPSIALRLDPADVDLLLKRPRFFSTPYGRGRWVSVWVDGRVSWTLVDRLVRRSHELAVRKRTDARST